MESGLMHTGSSHGKKTGREEGEIYSDDLRTATPFAVRLFVCSFCELWFEQQLKFKKENI